MERMSQCARCGIPATEKACQADEDGRGPDFCPTNQMKEVVSEMSEMYDTPEFKEFSRLASIQEAECYANRAPGPYVMQPEKTRIQETIEFARKLGCQRLGLAFCAGLQKEARMLAEILESHGYEVVSVVCKAGAVPKESIGLEDEEKIRIGSFEAMCNPLFQAEVLNRAETDLNIVVGLCVGHDAMFLKRSNAFTTVLAAKDRVTGHNPLAPLYTMHSYYRKLKGDKKK